MNSFFFVTANFITYKFVVDALFKSDIHSTDGRAILIGKFETCEQKVALFLS